MLISAALSMSAGLEKSNGHRTGKGHFSFQSQRKAMPKNIQTTAQLHSSHTLENHAQNSPNEASTVLQMLQSTLHRNMER